MLKNADSSLKFIEKKRPNISTRIIQSIPILDVGDQAYSLSFRARTYDLNNNSMKRAMSIFISFQGPNIDSREIIQRLFTYSKYWNNHSQRIYPPKNARSISVTFASYECGELQIDDVELLKLRYLIED